MSKSFASVAERPIWSRRTLAAGLTAAVLVALSDTLFFRQPTGISLFIFFAATSIGVLALSSNRWRDRTLLAAAVGSVLCALPLIEAATFTGFLCGLFGVSLLALGAFGKLPQRFEEITGTLLRFAVLAPTRLIGDGLRLLAEAGDQRLGGRAFRGALVWLVPLILAAVFIGLFSAANPLVEVALNAINLSALLDLLDPERLLFWGFVGMLIWPLLRPKLLGWRVAAPMQGPQRPKAESLVFGQAAVLRSLCIFNAIFAVQTVLDALFLWGGLRLPDGLSHADYAHRGAYPLIVTALLAAAFVLVAMRPGTEAPPLLRRLVYLWIAQNVWLVVSSILRLDLYVEAYSLTELRLASGIWMGLVAVGLVLIMARIALGRSSKWLIAANLAALGLTFYAISFMDFPDLIARFNVSHSLEISHAGRPLDVQYMRQLGPGALPALDDFIGRGASDGELARSIRSDLAGEVFQRSPDWRAWTWRAARLADYVAVQPYAAEVLRAIN